MRVLGHGAEDPPPDRPGRARYPGVALIRERYAKVAQNVRLLAQAGTQPAAECIGRSRGALDVH